eukprot:11776218-Alexandrium_andersonii.AAC.1
MCQCTSSAGKTVGDGSALGQHKCKRRAQCFASLMRETAQTRMAPPVRFGQEGQWPTLKSACMHSTHA